MAEANPATEPAHKKKSNGKKSKKTKQKDQEPADALKGSIFVERDYSKSADTCFSDQFPESLTKRGVTPQDFTTMITKLNRYFSEAEEINCTTVTEGCFGFLTFYSLLLCYQPRSHKLFHDMQDWLDQENKQVWIPKGLEVIDPISNGLIFLEIKVHQVK